MRRQDKNPIEHQSPASRHYRLFWGYLCVSDGDFAHFSHDWGVASIRRVNGDSAVAKHRFGARGGNRNIVALFFESDGPIRVFFDLGIGFAAREWIFKMPHMARGFDVFHVKI